MSRDLFDLPAYDALNDDQRATLSRLTSQAYIAVTDRDGAPTSDVEYYCTVAMKVLQRGDNPVTVHSDDAPRDLTHADLLRAAIGTVAATPFELDPTVRRELHETYEVPFWDMLQGHHPELQRFVHHQPRIEALTSAGSANSERWGDLLVAPPSQAQPLLIELDGSQHTTAERVDTARDAELRRAGIEIARLAGATALNWPEPLASALVSRSAPLGYSQPPHEHLTLVHAPSTITRLGVAIIALLRQGALRPGDEWVLTVDDEHGWWEEATPAVLDLLWAIDEVWQTSTRPSAVTVNGVQWRSTDGGLRRAAADADCEPQAAIYLQPFTPTWAVLPDTRIPAVVIRNAFLPVDLPWQPLGTLPRRDIPESHRPSIGIATIASRVFGVEALRDGQEESILHCLRGIDSCVLLPTGAGKSLVYQLAGILRPGLTIAVDPLVALVEDQVQRLHRLGISRANGLSSLAQSGQREREAALERLAHGDDLFAFFAPERLQIQAFRDTLRSLAERQSVGLIVVDEAHCVSEWGHDFRTAYLRMGRTLRELTRGGEGTPPPLVALTGTASPRVLHDVVLELETPGRAMELVRPSTFDRSNLHYGIVASTEGSWRSDLADLLLTRIPTDLECEPQDLVDARGHETMSGVVFVPHTNGTHGVEHVRAELVRILRDATGTETLPRIGIYSGKPPSKRRDWERDKTQEANAFKNNERTILVSTKAFGMGIDKPNIRWTVHLGYPSSIEAFAQEAGRAGRDGENATCLLLTVLPPHELAERLLASSTPHDERVRMYEAIPPEQSNDLTRQMYFLTRNYPGLEAEYGLASSLLDELLAPSPGTRLEIPRDDSRDAANGSISQERAMLRLAWLGIIDDYTIDYGSKRYVVDLAKFDADHLDSRIIEFVRRMTPLQVNQTRERIATAPTGLPERAANHLRIMLEALYRVIEPARTTALREMHRLATSGEDPQGIRDRIIQHLSNGPLAQVLGELATSERIDPDQIITELNTVPPDDPREWIGASARLLEAYPDQPVLLLVRALGEAWLPTPDAKVVTESFRDAFAGLRDLGVVPADRERLLHWLAEHLRSQHHGRAWGRVVDLFAAWEHATLDLGALERIEDLVLTRAAAGNAHPGELAYVLSRRVQRLSSRISGVLATMRAG